MYLLCMNCLSNGHEVNRQVIGYLLFFSLELQWLLEVVQAESMW